MSRKRAEWRFSVAIPLTIMMASCTAIPTADPVPAPTPAPRPVATPAPPRPVPVPAKPWTDRALDAGQWRYDTAARTTTFAPASGGAAIAALRCDGGNVDVTAALGAAGQTIDVDLRTSAGTDRLRFSDDRIALPNRDTRLDRIAFSRGRFALEASNGRTLTLPAHSEIGRLIEDCRG